MSDREAREIAVKLRQGTDRRIRERTRQIMDDGGRLRAGSGGKAGIFQPGDGGTGHTGGAEPPLPVAGAVGYILTSGPDNSRLWVPLIAGPGITIERNSLTGALTISVTDSLQGLTWGGDDLTWGGNIITWGMA